MHNPIAVKRNARPLRVTLSKIAAAAAIGAVSILPLQQTNAAAIRGVTVSAFSSEYISGVDNRVATNVLSDVGLYGDYSTVGPRGAMWLTTSATPAGPASITFDLGSVQTVNEIKVWNYNEAGALTNRGARTVDIMVAGEDASFSTLIEQQIFNAAPGLFTNIAQTIAVPGGSVQARYVRFDVLNNWGNANYNGLSKVRFINTQVPVAVKTVTRNYTGDRITVRFSEPVLASTATSLANYTLKQGATLVTINSAAMEWYTDRVVLSTPQLTAGLPYTLTVQGIQDAAGNPATLPATDFAVAPEFILWLKADAGVTESGGMVTGWADQSGAGNNASLLEGATSPAYVTGAINGKPSVRFDGINSTLMIPHSANIASDNQDLAFFAVVNVPTYTNYGMILNKQGSRNPNYAAPWDFEVAPSGGFGRSRFLRGNDSNATGPLGTINMISNQTYIISIVIRGTNATSYHNGLTNVSAVVNDAIGDCGNPVWIGNRPPDTGTGRTYPYLGDLPEMLLFRGGVSEAERVQIESYLGSKYGVTTPAAGPPVITSSPASSTNYVGDSATFTAVVSASGLSPKSFQWYRSPATAIQGATSNTLVLPPISLADDQTSYYLVVTNADGSATSQAATMTVLPLAKPYFIVQPQSADVYPGQAATLTALAMGSASITYQWYHNGTALPGATGTTLPIENIRAEESGAYHVKATNLQGEQASATANLNLLNVAEGTFPSGVLAARPLLYYRLNEVNTSTTATNVGTIGAPGNGSYVGPYSEFPGPSAPAYPVFESENLAYNQADLSSAGGVKFPKIMLYNTNGGPHATIAAWVYNGVDGGGQFAWSGIIYSRGTGVGTSGLSIGNGGDRLAYAWNNASHYNFNSQMTIPPLTWTFVAVAIEPTQAILFMNTGSGMVTATNNVSHAIVPALEGYVGYDSFALNRKWWGAIDEPMIFDRTLTVEQVNALYSATAMPPQIPMPVISIERNGTDGVVTWPPRSGTLQSAGSLTGPWTEMIGVPSPYTFTPSGEPGYFRLRAQ